MSFAARARASVSRRLGHFGTEANLAHLPGTTVSIGIVVTPMRERQVTVGDGRVLETVLECVVAANDPNLFAAPKPGDLLTLPDRQYRLIPGGQPRRANGTITSYVMRAKAS